MPTSPDPTTPVHGVRRVWTGEPHPLGARHDGTGTNFAIFSGVADGVELCLFDGPDREETRISNYCLWYFTCIRINWFYKYWRSHSRLFDT